MLSRPLSRAGTRKHMKYASAVILALSASTALASPQSEISAYRKSHGLSAVTADPALNALAARQANAMATSGVMDHSVYAPFAQRISAYNTGSAAENIAMGTKSAHRDRFGIGSRQNLLGADSGSPQRAQAAQGLAACCR